MVSRRISGGMKDFVSTGKEKLEDTEYTKKFKESYREHIADKKRAHKKRIDEERTDKWVKELDRKQNRRMLLFIIIFIVIIYFFIKFVFSLFG